MPRLVSGRKADAVMMSTFPGSPALWRGASLPTSQLVILFQHLVKFLRMDRFLRFSQDFSEEPTGEFVFSLRQTFPLIEGSGKIDEFEATAFNSFLFSESPHAALMIS